MKSHLPCVYEMPIKFHLSYVQEMCKKLCPILYLKMSRKCANFLLLGNLKFPGGFQGLEIPDFSSVYINMCVCVCV